MKALIVILIIVGVVYGARELISYYKKTERAASGEQSQPNPAPPPVSPEQLPGLPSTFEASLQAAQKEGATGLKNWLKKYRAYVQDPRLAAIELDYVVQVLREDPKEARQVFQSVKNRIPPSSPVYARVKKLESTFAR